MAQNFFTSESGLGYTGSDVGRTRVLQVAAQADVQHGRFDLRDDSGFRTFARDYRAYAIEAFLEQPLRQWAATASPLGSFGGTTCKAAACCPM